VEVGWQALVFGIDHLECSVDLGGQYDVFPIGHVFEQSDIPGVYGFISGDLLVGLLEQVVWCQRFGRRQLCCCCCCCPG